MGKHSKIIRCGLEHESPSEVSRAITTINTAVTANKIIDNGNKFTISVVVHIMMPLNTLARLTKQQRDVMIKSGAADVNAIISALNRDYNNTSSTGTLGDPLSNKYTSVCPPVDKYTNMLSLSRSADIFFKCVRIVYADLKGRLTNNDTIDTKNVIIKTGSPPVTPDKCLNIWLVNGVGGGILGYAVFPWDTVNRPKYDGVVLERQVSGATSIYQQYALNRTVVHEVGHWAGLYHTFQNPITYTTIINPAAVIDANKDNKIDDEEQSYDCVKDTPLQIFPTSGNPLVSKTWPYTLVDSTGKPTLVSGNPQAGTWTCSHLDNEKNNKTWTMFMNYMDYTDDTAMFMFTSDQVNKMRLTLLALRAGVVAQ